MADRKIISIEHHQTLTSTGDQPGWSERFEVSVRIFGDAIKSGWMAQFTGHHGNDLPVLLTIAMHGRPLKGEDLALLIRLGLATRQDDGRLYARVTDEGLAAELGIKRDTVDASARRLAEKGLLTILHLAGSNGFRDSRGRYGGTKLYLLSGDLSGRLVKEIGPVAAGPANNLIHHAQNLGTVSLDTVPENRAPSAQLSGTNIDPVVDVVVSEHETARAYFLNRQGGDYVFSDKDEKELAGLFELGYTLAQVQAGIDTAFDLPNPPQRFVQCARVTRQRLSPSGHPVSQPPVIRSAANQTPDASTEEAGVSTETKLTASSAITNDDPVSSPLSPQLLPAVAILGSILGRPTTDADLSRLKHLAELCSETASKVGESGHQWLAEALALTLTAENVKSPIRYAESILRLWVSHGKGADPRPVRESYRPQRKTVGQSHRAEGKRPVDGGDESDVINGQRVSRAEADAFYADIRRKREARHKNGLPSSTKGEGT